MSDADLIAQFLAQGGEVVKCPPRTYSTDPSQPYSWRKGNAASWKARKAGIIAAERRREAAEKMLAEIPAGQVPKPAKKAKAPAKEKAIPGPRKSRTIAGEVPIERITYMIRNGMTGREVAAELGCPPASIASRLKRQGLKITELRGYEPRAHIDRKGCGGIPDDEVRAAVDGRTLSEAANVLGIGERHLRKRMASLDIKTRRPVVHNLKPVADIVSRVESGMTVRQIADELGVATSTISCRMKRAKISVNSIMVAYHKRTFGHTRGLGPVKARGGNIVPCEIGEYRWESRKAAADALRVNHNTLAGWLQPGAGKRSQAKLARAVAEWVRRSERVAA